MTTLQVKVDSAGKIVKGHVLDVAQSPLLAALRCYDPQLYVKWNSKKRGGIGCWELRRKPEFKSVLQGRVLDTPRGRVRIPGDVYDCFDYTISVPKYNENHAENHVKDFDYLTYEMVSWIAQHDLWKYGYKGKYAMHEAEYKEGQYLTRLEDEVDAEHKYMLKQHKTEFNDFREYILAGGNPHRLLDYWNKV